MAAETPPQEITVAVRIDPEQLAAFRLLLSQIGFAIDNYLLAVTKPEVDDA